MIKVLNCKKEKDKYLIEVENNPFYVDLLGGQLGDRGKIGNANVLASLGNNKLYIDRELKMGDYEYVIDKKRQEDIAIQHSSQHIFSAIAKKFYDYNTVGFRMGETYTTVDLDSNLIDKKIIEHIEREVNDVISREIQIEIFKLSNEEAREIKGLRKQISSKIEDDVRFVKIGDVDLGACAGFHVENTSEIKIFKIIHSEHIKGKYTRFYFLAGNRAYNDYIFKDMLSAELRHMFSCQNYEILDMIDKIMQSKKEIENKFRHLCINYAELLKEKLIKNADAMGNYKIIFYDGDNEINNILHKIINENDIITITKDSNNYIISSKNFDLKSLFTHLKSIDPDILGGGNNNRINLKSKNLNKDILIEKIKNILFVNNH